MADRTLLIKELNDSTDMEFDAKAKVSFQYNVK